jgi:hypothetical protein
VLNLAARRITISHEKDKEDKIGGACSTRGGKVKYAYKTLVGCTEVKEPLRRPGHRWKENGSSGSKQ